MPIRSVDSVALIQELVGRHVHAGSFCFFTEVANLPSIFYLGRVLCRQRALAAGLIKVDTGSARILGRTPAWVHDHVRIYFAPLSPMLFRVEGIKRSDDEWPHCPRPLYLVFTPDVLSIEGTRVSNGNMSVPKTNCPLDPDIGFLRSLPFDGIFGRGALPSGPEAKRELIRQRHAEVLVPSEVPLDYVEKIVFRSDAERDLAFRDIYDLSDRVTVEVNANWFFAPREGRPYLRTFVNDELDVANVVLGDYLVQVTTSRTGRIEGWLCYFGPDEWGDWEPAPVDNLPPPNPGWTRYFLNGWRVAEKPS